MDGKHIVVEHYGHIYNCKINIGKYQYGNGIALQLMSYDSDFDYYEPFGTLTVNLVDMEEPFAFIDTNNCPFAIELMEYYSLGEPTGTVRHSGYCTYPLYKLNMEEIKKYEI